MSRATGFVEQLRCTYLVTTSRPWLAIILCGMFLAATGSPHQANAAEPVRFARDIAPILEQRCIRCHSHGKPKGGLSFSSKAEFLRGGDSGPVLVRDQRGQSLLLEMISGSEPQMPAEGVPLTSAEINKFRQWIAEGADWPDALKLQERAAGGRDWWSFQPVSHAMPPTVQELRWAQNPIDRFIFAKLADRGLTPSPEADPRTLIRRLSFDLLGLPPKLEEVEAFVGEFEAERASSSAATVSRAYERLVDRFLKSPHYGERWARHWLDIAHYADTHGFERDQRRDNAWPYRDYVIRSLNADKRYDDFLREQIAGDVLKPDDADAVIATGFLAAGPWDFVGQVETRSDVLRRAARADDLDDMVTQVMTAACGLTVNCARCHDHKLDPITQHEYYQLWAVFAGVKRGERDSHPADIQRVEGERAKLNAELQTVRARILKLKGDSRNLADIVGGGNGDNTGKLGAGIDPVTGKVQTVPRGFVSAARANTFAKSEVKFVDGVVIPDASDEGTQISSTGLRVQKVPKTSGQVWDAVRFGPINSQFSTKLGDIDFAANGHSLLSLHANAAITFDLNTIRAAGLPGDLKFTTTAGYFGQTPKAGASFFIYLDGELKTERVAIGRDDGPQSLELPIPVSSRFLTLMATDNGNGIGHDQICFADAILSPLQPTTLSEPERAELAKLEERGKDIDRLIGALPKSAKVYAVVSEAPPAIRTLHRGDPEQPREEAAPGSIGCLTGLNGELKLAASDEGARRLALANWIVDPANPLTRRVLVNRLWHHHFGVGLVDTPSDFGFGGGKPSHPELLDWLADEFARGGWSMKHMHRLICLSAAYRQISKFDSTDSGSPKSPQAVDSSNRLLWRMNPRRLDAESLRDAVLATSGKLNLTMYGAGYRDFDYVEAYAPIYNYITPDQSDLWRRSIYRFVVRTTAHQFLTTLDCPNPANLTPSRNVTTTALQSLALLNNDFMLRQSVHFADRVQREAGDNVEAQIRRAFVVAFARQPSANELDAAKRFLKDNKLPQLCRMLLNANEFVYID